MKRVLAGKNGPGAANKLLILLTLLSGGMLSEAVAQIENLSEPRQSLAGEKAAQELARSLTNEDYNIHLGPVLFQTQARVGAAYTDNVLLSGTDKKDDFIINPELDLAAMLPVGRFNSLKLALGVSYEWYAKNHSLNSDIPLINPDSELAFYLFVGDFRIKLHEKFSYQQSLAFNVEEGDNLRLFNFNDVGRFDRMDNFVGPTIDWDLNKVILTVSYDHENFISTTERFKYLDRSSEWLAATANYLLGDRTKAGLEGQVGYHSYDQETVLNDNWRVRVGPFAQMRLPNGLILRAGGGYDMARFDSAALPGNDYDNWYAYGKIAQETKWFTHSLGAGHETLLGDNANNLRTTYVRYSISSDVIRNTELEGHMSVNISREFGGTFEEKFIHYLAGCRIGYQFFKYWRAELGYELFYKDSEFGDRVFHRNRVSLDLNFKF
jgi:hypothetical protein